MMRLMTILPLGLCIIGYVFGVQWPHGTYILVKPSSGYPQNWHEGWRKQDNEDDDNSNNITPTSNFAGLIRARDCQDYLWMGWIESKVYRIYPRGTGSFNVYCDMRTAGGGWTVIQRRFDGSTNFYRKWMEYKYGFGEISHEYWLGNHRIHQLTSQGWYELRIDMQDFKGVKKYALYRRFFVGNEASGYKLDVSDYQGNAGDSLKYHNGHAFYTKDRDTKTHSCAKTYKGAWWYGECHKSNLNGLYLNGSHSSFANGMNWQDWHGYHYSLKSSVMKIRRL